MMKILNTLEEYWQVPIRMRKHYAVGEEISTSYPIQDNGEKLISLQEYFQEQGVVIIYDPPKEIADIKQKLLLRKTAAMLLLEAAKKLSEQYVFYVSEGYRPLWFQRLEFDRIFKDMKKKHPKWSKKKVWELTTMYIADPELYPPHSSGGTIDLTIANPNGTPIDMGNPMNTVDIKSNTFAKNVTKKQKANRMLLFDTLTGVGFVNIPSEWWHYSYGDQYWAIYNKKPYAIYNKVEV